MINIKHCSPMPALLGGKYTWSTSGARAVFIGSSDNEIYNYYCIAWSQSLKQIKLPHHATPNIRLNNIKQYQCTPLIPKGKYLQPPYTGDLQKNEALQLLSNSKLEKQNQNTRISLNRLRNIIFSIEIQPTRAWGKWRADEWEKE